MADAIQIGPIAQHSGDVDRLLRDPALSALVTVSLLEELPVAETKEFVRTMQKEFGMEMRVVANKMLDVDMSVDELEKLKNLELGEFSKYAGGIENQIRTQTEQLDVLNKEFGPDQQAGQPSGHQVFVLPRMFSVEPRQMIAQTEEALRALSTRS
jgi:hypothetical protein